MNEIIAAIVGAVVTGAIGLGIYYYRGRQGNRIIVKRISETPQIKISEEVRKNLKISYNDQPVDNLVLNNLVVYNNGNEIIEPVDILIWVDTSEVDLDYLEVEEDDPLGMTTISIGGPCFSFERPYINPKRKFKEEEIKLAVFSNTGLTFSVEGGGRGWYPKFEDGTQKNRISKFFDLLEKILSFAFGGFILLAILSRFIENNPELMILLALIWAIIATALGIYAFSRSEKR